MTKLCPRGKAAAKRKFAVYPSAYANAYASKICAGKIKDPSGVKRKDFKGRKPAMGGGMMKRATYMGGGLTEATAKLKRQGLKEGSDKFRRRPNRNISKGQGFQMGPVPANKRKKFNKKDQGDILGDRFDKKFKKLAESKETQLHSKNFLKGVDRAEKRAVKEVMQEAGVPMAKGGRAMLKGGGICKKGMNRKAVGKNS